MLHRSPAVAAFIRGLATEAKAEVDGALAYLNEHGRSAALPDVRHRLQTSRHFPDMSEVRVLLPGVAYRILFAFARPTPSPTRRRRQGRQLGRLVRHLHPPS